MTDNQLEYCIFLACLEAFDALGEEVHNLSWLNFGGSIVEGLGETELAEAA